LKIILKIKISFVAAIIYHLKIINTSVTNLNVIRFDFMMFDSFK